MKFRFIQCEDPEYQAELMLRWEALRKPLGLPPGSERHPEEAESIHLLALEGKRIVGCVLFYPENSEKGRLYQMAVSEEYRGQGFGRKLLAKLEESLKQKGYHEVYLYARDESLGFYERMGFHKEGNAILKDGLDHFLMRKQLAVAA
jgi:ribosomal protein S18 acetylase RimI-like enzyme